MNKICIIMLSIALVMVTGCSMNNKVGSVESWDYTEGYVISKENGRVLIVRERVNNIEKTPLNKILKEAQPNAIWLSVMLTTIK